MGPVITLFLALVASTPAEAAGTIMSSGMMGGMTAAIAVPIVYALLRKAKSYRYVPDSTVSIDPSKYRRWDLISRGLLVAYAGALAFACWFLLNTIEDFRASLLGPAPFVLTPIRVIFGVPSILAGIFLSAIPIRLTVSRFIGTDGYRQLVEYGNRRQGLDSERVFRHMVYVLAPLLIGSVLPVFQTYATADAQSFVLHPYFALRERSYGWDEVKSITLVKSFKAPNGNIRRDRPHFVIRMEDGFEFNFHNTLLEIPYSRQERFITFAAAHAHRSVEIDDPYP